jgi:hypothetical protein
MIRLDSIRSDNDACCMTCRRGEDCLCSSRILHFFSPLKSQVNILSSGHYLLPDQLLYISICCRESCSQQGVELSLELRSQPQESTYPRLSLSKCSFATSTCYKSSSPPLQLARKRLLFPGVIKICSDVSAVSFCSPLRSWA